MNKIVTTAKEEIWHDKYKETKYVTKTLYRVL